jgi:hypothetical protein
MLDSAGAVTGLLVVQGVVLAVLADALDGSRLLQAQLAERRRKRRREGHEILQEEEKEKNSATTGCRRRQQNSGNGERMQPGRRVWRVSLHLANISYCPPVICGLRPIYFILMANMDNH